MYLQHQIQPAVAIVFGGKTVASAAEYFVSSLNRQC